MAIPALALFAVTATGVVAPWMVFVAGLRRGTVNAVDNPTRQSFVIEMVGADRVVNAVSLNSVIVQSARIVGPALAGLLIAAFGVEPCFAAQRAHLRGDDRRPLADGPGAAARARRAPSASPARSAPACATCARTPELAVPLALMALVGTLRLQLPGGPAAAGPVQLRRRRRRPTRRWSRRWASARSSAPWSTGAHGRTGAAPDRRRRARLRRPARCWRRRCPAWPSRSRCSPCSAPPR